MASQEAELTLKKQNIETLITKIGLQTERVSSKRKAADVEAQKVKYHLLYRFSYNVNIYHTIHYINHMVGYCCYGQVSAIQAEVSVKQRDCENDLAKAEPSLTAATAALHTLNKVLHFIRQN